MSRKRTNPYKPFMILNAVLAFAVFAVVCLFLYLSFTLKKDADKIITYEGKYHIEISNELAGKDISLYINDSLLLKRVLPDTLVPIEINRFAEENTLIIVDNQTDIASPFNLNKNCSKIIINSTDDKITITEKIAD